jgi:hypothetical protein
MNIAIDRNRKQAVKGLGFALRLGAVASLLAIGLTQIAGNGDRNANPTNAQPSTRVVGKAVPEVEHVYYVLDSQQAAANALIADAVTAQEQLLAGVVAPARIVHIIDDSAAGRITAAEAILVAH